MINITYPVTLTGEIKTGGISIGGNLAASSFYLNGSLECSPGGAPYPGPYTVTPSLEIQILNTSNKLMTSNVTIAKIPGTLENNYGKITWDGSTITVS